MATVGVMERNPALSPEEPLASANVERPVRTDLETSIPKPNMPRGLAASDTYDPTGTPGHVHNNFSVLQQHVAFFDQDDNGIVYPWETYVGQDRKKASLYYVVFHLNHPRVGYLLLSSRFTYMIYNIHKAKHGSDSGTYDIEGRYFPVNFENIFSKYARTVPDKVTLRELWNMTEGNRQAFDIFGWVASKLEWGVLYVLVRDEEGFLSKEAIRRCYDGSLFEYCAKMQMGAKKKMK